MKKVILWSSDARADLRRIDRATAMRILEAVDRFVSTGAGDTKKLRPPRREYRLRVQDYRVFFLPRRPTGILIVRVLHRSEAYR